MAALATKELFCDKILYGYVPLLSGKVRDVKTQTEFNIRSCISAFMQSKTIFAEI